MIDFVNEQPMKFQQAAELLGVSYDTVWKWSIKGHRGKFLDSAKVGGLIYTSREAIQRFSTGRGEESTQVAPPQVNAADARAKKNLERRGVDGGKWKKRFAEQAAKRAGPARNPPPTGCRPL